jgi:hypothetical protein
VRFTASIAIIHNIMKMHNNTKVSTLILILHTMAVGIIAQTPPRDMARDLVIKNKIKEVSVILDSRPDAPEEITQNDFKWEGTKEYKELGGKAIYTYTTTQNSLNGQLQLNEYNEDGDIILSTFNPASNDLNTVRIAYKKEYKNHLLIKKEMFERKADVLTPKGYTTVYEYNAQQLLIKEKNFTKGKHFYTFTFKYK